MLVGGGKGCQACQQPATEANRQTAQANRKSSDSSCSVPLSQRWLQSSGSDSLKLSLFLFPVKKWLPGWLFACGMRIKSGSASLLSLLSSLTALSHES